MIDTGLYIGYVLFFGALLIAVLLPLISAFRSPQTLVRMMIALALFGVLFLLSFVFSSSEITNEYIARGITEQSSRVIGAGLIMFYIVFFIAISSIVFSQVSRLLKR